MWFRFLVFHVVSVSSKIMLYVLFDFNVLFCQIKGLISKLYVYPSVKNTQHALQTLFNMGKRAVFLEKSWVDVAGAVGIFHYAVKVEDDWYEIEAEGGGKKKGKRNTINGSYLNGHPKSDDDRASRINPALTLAGATYKDDWEILDFNREWISNTPRYDALSDNCQKFALDLIQFLVGGSFKMEIPLTQVNAWADRPGSHSVVRGDYESHRATTGKAGAQWSVFAAEAEGPSAAAEKTSSYIGLEASLGRAEAQAYGAAARLEPNLNTGFGVNGGQVKAKAAGFGITVGKGFGLHTPLGSIGWGKF